MEEKLKLKNFEELIDPAIVERGLQYYDEGAVHDLQKEANGLWMAMVSGTADYMVSVNTHRSVIKDWECDCPYDHGPVCKHVVAVFYEIADVLLLDDKETKVRKKPQSGKKKKKRKTQKEQLNEILDKVEKNDLLKFIEKQIDLDTGLRHVFLAHFADLIEEDLKPKYKRLVKNFIQAASDRYGFIDYKSSYDFAHNIQSLIDKAEHLLSKNNLNETIIICQAIIDGMAEAITDMDDSNGLAGDQIDQAFEMLANAISLVDAPMMKDELFNYCLKEYPKQKYIDFEFDVRFLDLMPMLISGTKQEEQFFQLIDDAINKEKTNPFPDWRITILLKQKIEYLQAQKRDSEANQIIESGLEYPEIRKMQVEALVKSKENKEAKKLVQQGIELAKKQDHAGTLHHWMDYLLLIAEKEKDTESIQLICRQLFLENSSGYMPYYKKLKKTYPTKEWEKEVEKMLDIIKGPEERGLFSDLTKMANVFVAETYWPRLLKLMQLNVQHFYFVLENVFFLPEPYTADLHGLLMPGLKQLAEPTGRGKYNELARCLKKVFKLPGGENIVREIVEWVSEKYQNRPAMLEVIFGKFPKMKPPVKSKAPEPDKPIQPSIFEN